MALFLGLKQIFPIDSVCICSFVRANSSLLFSDNIKFQNLKDVTKAAQLAAQRETHGMSF